MYFATQQNNKKPNKPLTKMATLLLVQRPNLVVIATIFCFVATVGVVAYRHYDYASASNTSSIKTTSGTTELKNTLPEEKPTLDALSSKDESSVVPANNTPENQTSQQSEPVNNNGTTSVSIISTQNDEITESTVRINGAEVEIPANGRINKTVKDENGTTKIRGSIRSNGSSSITTINVASGGDVQTSSKGGGQ